MDINSAMHDTVWQCRWCFEQHENETRRYFTRYCFLFDVSRLTEQWHFYFHRLNLVVHNLSVSTRQHRRQFRSAQSMDIGIQLFTISTWMGLHSSRCLVHADLDKSRSSAVRRFIASWKLCTSEDRRKLRRYCYCKYTSHSYISGIRNRLAERHDTK